MHNSRIPGPLFRSLIVAGCAASLIYSSDSLVHEVNDILIDT